ncbi:hypothetical protein [Paenibacillus sedimenti]|uniref:Uncharacterized protein n=1 Tax=Paenibacillus sedimenti TaxID=2770274 RepID=A0A926QM28_9BACL|nr:hypothetical protein [Paenibacillus sedimenti]MBD0383202.1 hypothetical protein [Paenibacillus sedimenti]
MTDKKITDQTAFETAGIPTPSNQENIASTDKISEVIKGIMDNIEDGIYPETDRNHK